MLQQILKDLWVDPELLERLDEDQKQQLFCRMREEQVRRWKIWDQEQLEVEAKRTHKPPSVKKKKVDFLLGGDGEPWVWVMGEHQNDKTIEQILEEEARQKALDLAKKEAEELRKKIEAELLIDEEQWKDARSDVGVLDIYSSAEEIKDTFKKPPPPIGNMRKMFELPESNNREALQELNKFNKKPATGVASRVAQWEQRLMEERSTQIFHTLQKKKQELVHEAEKDGQKQEELWREQERKAKEAEQQIREIARRAREEHRRSSVLMDAASPPPSPSPVGTTRIPHSPLQNSSSSLPTSEHGANNYSSPNITPTIGIPTTQHTTESRPPNKEAIYEWFHKSEKARKAGIDPSTNQTARWFHGLITRKEAEGLLKEQEVGAFLVRISEKIWGYAISLKEEGRCKHYLVDASNGHYQFPGQNQIAHKTLADLVSYHSWEPITTVGKELLKKPCDWNKPPEICTPTFSLPTLKT